LESKANRLDLLYVENGARMVQTYSDGTLAK